MKNNNFNWYATIAMLMVLLILVWPAKSNQSTHHYVPVGTLVTNRIGELGLSLEKVPLSGAPTPAFLHEGWLYLLINGDKKISMGNNYTNIFDPVTFGNFADYNYAPGFPPIWDPGAKAWWDTQTRTWNTNTPGAFMVVVWDRPKQN